MYLSFGLVSIFLLQGLVLSIFQPDYFEWVFNSDGLLLLFWQIFVISGILFGIYLLSLTSTRVFTIFGVFFFLVFFFLVFFFSLIRNLFFLLFLYELFIFPSVYFIYIFSPNIRLFSALIYFLLWTQVGSFLVIIGLCALFQQTGVFTIGELTESLSIALSLCFLLGFGIKIPIWPFHFWLTKTHVEAPTFFSIYLSGFLVKTAVLGLVVFIPILSTSSIYLGLLFGFLGIIDATLKFFIQVDLKKLVAYTTIQEMNIIFILLLTLTAHWSYILLSFVLAHTLLSTLFFAIVDVIFKKRLTRTVFITGIWAQNYLFGFILFISVLFYIGFPLTIKFFLEVKLFLLLFNLNIYLGLLFLVIINVLGTIFFVKIWFNVLFGTTHLKFFFFKKKEILFFSFFSLVFLLLIFVENLN